MFKFKISATLLLCLVAFVGFAQQSAEELINEALGNLKKKDYKETSNSLQQAINEVNRLMAEDVNGKLPAEIAGYKMKKGDANNSGSSAAFGGGVTVVHEYFKNGQEAVGEEPYFEFSIIGNSATIAAMSMMLSNPMILSASGARTMKIGSRKGILKTEGSNRVFQLPLSSSMFAITGHNFNAESDFTAIINSIKFDDIIKALGE